MARKEAEVIDNKFIKGLITETTALNFPEDACTETWNCVFDNTGKITRRKGLDYETDWETISASLIEADDAFTEYLWEVSNGVALKSFVVQQVGRYIRFYDVSDSPNIGENIEDDYTIDLDTYKPSSFFYSPKDFACHYSQGNNQLLIVNKAIDPIMIKYDADADDIIVTVINLKYRDFEGIDDRLQLTERPTSTLINLSQNNPEHYYNIMNQGWHVSDAILGWDTARTDMPSNADQVAFFRASDTVAFDNDIVDAFSSVLNTPAPKGHFILDVAKTDRSAALTNEGFAGGIIGGTVTEIPYNVGTILGNTILNSSAVFDDTTTQIGDDSGQGAIIKSTTLNPPSTTWFTGKSYAGVEPKIIDKAVVYPSSDMGFYTDSGFEITDIRIQYQLRASNTPPANAASGTKLGEYLNQITDENNPTTGSITINSVDKYNDWNYVWVAVFYNHDAVVVDISGYIAEVKFYEIAPDTGVIFPELEGSLSYSRPQTCAYFAGRAWYAGIEDAVFNNNIYYSRIILKDEDYEKCYQANDPTSELISDLLPDDGGVIRIIDAARILKIFNYQNSLLVFATNGVWRVSGGSGQGMGFQANSFSIRKIADIGIDSPQSLVSVEGSPVWWSENGIYTVKYNQDFDAFTVDSLSDNTIKTFIQDIPRINRKYVKGLYNPFDNRIQWYYNDTSSESFYKYNKILNLNTLTGAFYPWSVEATNMKIRGPIFIRNSARTYDPVTKIILSKDGGTSLEDIIFGEFKNTDYEDWTIAEDQDHEPNVQDYTSYFITGYKIHGGAMRYNQIKYLIVYLNTLENSGCFVRSVYDFTNSGNSGRWSSSQQIYNSTLDMLNRRINTRRLKLRGRGRSIQLKFTSESGKPFEIIGWAIAETQSAGL